ncbi:MAG: hypothetical protein ACN6O8_19920 [Achromobacter sp.]|uniref:hypothetical protein n=1 Tax=Achromobacter sp. TaxID=134375 RepID=UPI003D070F10
MMTPTPCASPDREGFWFDAADPDMALERAGDHVRLARAEPPWLVVDQSIASLTLGRRWPGQLWRVRVTQLGDMSGPLATPPHGAVEASPRSEWHGVLSAARRRGGAHSPIHAGFLPYQFTRAVSITLRSSP